MVRRSEGALSWWIAGLMAVGLASVAAALWLTTENVLGRLAGVSGVLGALVAVAMLLAGLVSRSRDSSDVDDAAATLADIVGQVWRQEAVARGLSSPDPIRVRWSWTPPWSQPISWAAAVPSRTNSNRLEQLGYVTEVGTFFESLSIRQLVIIGEPGAGKTSLAVLLLCDLLARRRPGGEVPILLNLSDWDPGRQNLDVWIAESVRSRYLATNDAERDGLDPVARLLLGRRILPILDGLDEMDNRQQIAAIHALNETVGRDRSLIVTCRTQEFDNAVSKGGQAITHAAVVALEPIATPQVCEYLQAGSTDVDRWALVVAHLTSHPSGALSSALSTPLMVYLARTAYGRPGSDPNELTKLKVASDIRNHLVTAYVPSVYYRRPPSLVERWSTRSYDSAKVSRWLGFLAESTRERGCFDDFFNSGVDFRSAFGAAGLTTGLVVSLVVARSHGAWPGFVAAFAYFTLMNVLFLTLPVLVVARKEFEAVMLIGLVSVVVFVGLLGFRAGFLVGLWVGLTVAVSRAQIRQWRSEHGRRSLWSQLREWLGLAPELWVALLLVPGSGVVVGRVFALWFGFASLLIAGTVFIVLTELSYLFLIEAHYRRFGAVMSGRDFDFFGIRSPRRSRPQTNDWIQLGFLVGFGVGFSSLDGLAHGMIIVLAAWLWIRSSAGLRPVTARIWLGMHGFLPWRLRLFLRDAHRRGVLRIVGDHYQVRHKDIEDYLCQPAHWNPKLEVKTKAREPVPLEIPPWPAMPVHWAAGQHGSDNAATGDEG